MDTTQYVPTTEAMYTACDVCWSLMLGDMLVVVDGRCAWVLAVGSNEWMNGMNGCLFYGYRSDLCLHRHSLHEWRQLSDSCKWPAQKIVEAERWAGLLATFYASPSSNSFFYLLLLNPGGNHPSSDRIAAQHDSGFKIKTDQKLPKVSLCMETDI